MTVRISSYMLLVVLVALFALMVMLGLMPDTVGDLFAGISTSPGGNGLAPLAGISTSPGGG